MSPTSAGRLLTRYSPIRWILLGVVMAMSVAMEGCPGSPKFSSIRECPHTWDFGKLELPPTELGVRRKLVKVSTLAMVSSSGDPNTLSAPNRNTNVPEFHDCQRLIVTEGTIHKYDSLYALFASEHLDTIFTVISDSGIVTGKTAVPAAEIFSIGGTYDPLQIKTGFNCLYLKREGPGWEAWMVSYGEVEQDCNRTQDASMIGGNWAQLAVRQVPTPAGFTDGDFPPVARWDWDPKTGQQVIGLKCGTAWCEVGSQNGFRTMLPLSVPQGLTSAEVAVTRVYQVKGWYDEQELASASNPLVPSGIVGTFIPDPGLGRHEYKGNPGTIEIQGPFHGHWERVAEAYLSQEDTEYKRKFNLGKRGPNGEASVFNLCSGEKGDCLGADLATANKESCIGVKSTGPHWWLRIDAPDGTQVYRCVSRMDHSNLEVPATARWRWNLNDETTWIRCTNGCCQGGA